MVKLRHLKIERYRNVEPCDLTFSDGLNVVLGQNGAGKTTLLNFISKVLRTNLADASDPFAIEIDLVFPGGSLKGRIATRAPEPGPLGLEQFPNAPSAFASPSGAGRVVAPDFEVAFEGEEPHGKVAIRGAENVFRWEREVRGRGVEQGAMPPELFTTQTGLLGYLVLMGFRAGTTTLVDRWLQVLWNTSEALRFDEGLDLYRSVVARAGETATPDPEARPVYGIAHSAEDASEPHPVAAGLLGRQLRAALGSRLTENGAQQLSVSDSDVPFLREIVQLLGLQSAEARFELVERQVTSAGTLRKFGNLRFWLTRKDGSIFQDPQLSYGQKRLLAFLYYLDANPSFVIADELVNGMHHYWIEECVRAIADRQAFLTSQNPLLLDYLTFESAEQVRSSFVVCRTELRDGQERMIWRNFTDDEAEMFFSAYQVGIEHVGEILRTRGLW